MGTAKRVRRAGVLLVLVLALAGCHALALPRRIHGAPQDASAVAAPATTSAAAPDAPSAAAPVATSAAGPAATSTLPPRATATTLPGDYSGPPAPRYELAHRPPGYQAPILAPYTTPDDVIVQYLPSGADPPDPVLSGTRLSVLSSVDHTPDQLTGSYTVEKRLTVRGGKAAVLFAVAAAPNPHARHGLAWQERPGLTLAVYAYAGESELVRLADDVVRR